MESEVATSAQTFRVLVVDDHPIFRHGITHLISTEADLEICGEASSARDALSVMRSAAPDVAVVDISMPGTNGIDLVKSMRAEMPNLPVLVLSAHDESLYAIRALRAGASGYLMKKEAVESVVPALRKILTGAPFVSDALSNKIVLHAIQSSTDTGDSPVSALSDREMEVLTHVGRGRGSQEIADELNLSVKTIETHRANIKEKLGFADSKEVNRFAIEWANSTHS